MTPCSFLVRTRTILRSLPGLGRLLGSPRGSRVQRRRLHLLSDGLPLVRRSDRGLSASAHQSQAPELTNRRRLRPQGKHHHEINQPVRISTRGCRLRGLRPPAPRCPVLRQWEPRLFVRPQPAPRPAGNLSGREHTLETPRNSLSCRESRSCSSSMLLEQGVRLQRLRGAQCLLAVGQALTTWA
jgi:hypothetical protein